jgi:hypothetical protein
VRLTPSVEITAEKIPVDQGTVDEGYSISHLLKWGYLPPNEVNPKTNLNLKLNY